MEFTPEKQAEILRLAAEVHRTSKARADYFVANRAVMEGTKNKAFRIINNQHTALRAAAQRAEFALCDAIRRAE